MTMSSQHSPALTKGAPKLERLEQLGNLPLIHWDLSQIPWAQRTRKWFDWGECLRLWNVSHLDPDKGLRFSDYGLAVQAAVSGQGVLLAGWPVLKDSMEAGLLICPFADSMVSTDIGYDVMTTRDAAERPEVSCVDGSCIARHF